MWAARISRQTEPARPGPRRPPCTINNYSYDTPFNKHPWVPLWNSTTTSRRRNRSIVWPRIWRIRVFLPQSTNLPARSRTRQRLWKSTRSGGAGLARQSHFCWSECDLVTHRMKVRNSSSMLCPVLALVSMYSASHWAAKALPSSSVIMRLSGCSSLNRRSLWVSE